MAEAMNICDLVHVECFAFLMQAGGVSSLPDLMELDNASMDALQQQIRIFAAGDFKRFLWFEAFFKGFARVPWHHYVMADFLQGNRPNWIRKKKLARGFRLAAKSYIARSFCRWRQLPCPWTQVIIHSSTDDMANDFARSYFTEMSGPLTAHLAPPPGSSELAFNLAGIRPEVGYSVEVAGIRTSMTGRRSDIYLFDDPEPDVDPEAWHERIIRAFMEASHILHSPNRHLTKMGLTTLPRSMVTQLIVVGQPHCSTSPYILPGENDLTPFDEENAHPLSDAGILDIDVIDSRTGYWLWQEIMHEKYFDHEHGRPQTIAEVKKTFTTENWELQMRMNYKFLAGAGAVLHLDEIEKVHRLVKDPWMVIDPADGGACEFGVAIGGAVGNGIHICCMAGLRGEAWENMEDAIGETVWRRIFDIADEFHVSRVFLEKNLKTARMACRRYIAKTARPIAVEEYAASGNKNRRICRALEQPVNNGVVSAEPMVFADPENLRQLSRLRWDKLPDPCDRIDALADLVERLTEQRGALSSSVAQYDPYLLRRPQAARAGVSDVSPLARIHG